MQAFLFCAIPQYVTMLFQCKATHNMTSVYRAVAIFVIVAIFITSSIPAIVQSIPSTMHYVAHCSAYAFMAAIICLGWPKIKLIRIATLVASVGILHELSEIITHHHGFEYIDAIIDGMGALVGTVILKGLQYYGQKEKPPGYL